MDFDHSPKVEALLAKLSEFMDELVIPRNRQYLEEFHAGKYTISFMEALKAKAKAEGLWNLFLPHLRDDEPGTGLTNLEYAPLAECMGRLQWAPEVFNCSAPDTGNMELLHMFASEQQREQWLNPLLRGEIRSCFAMTEPDVASSDATNINTAIERNQDGYIINGRKWYISGAGNPACKVAILMGKTDVHAPTHQQQSMVIVPLDTPGVTIVRDMSVLNHHSRETHCEILFDNVRVPASNLLGEEGAGFALAQARLGPGRIHHCMRSIGQAKLALDLMAERALTRSPFGKPLHEQGVIQEMMARSAIEIEQARLLVLKAAWLIDRGGAKAARNEIAMIKVSVPQVTQTVIDRAIQVFGAMGLSQDVPLSEMLGTARTLRIADGPDEVHLRSIAKGVIKHTKDNLGQAQRFLTQPDRSQEKDIRSS